MELSYFAKRREHSLLKTVIRFYHNPVIYLLDKLV